MIIKSSRVRKCNHWPCREIHREAVRMYFSWKNTSLVHLGEHKRQLQYTQLWRKRGLCVHKLCTYWLGGYNDMTRQKMAHLFIIVAFVFKNMKIWVKNCTKLSYCFISIWVIPWLLALHFFASFYISWCGLNASFNGWAISNFAQSHGGTPI